MGEPARRVQMAMPVNMITISPARVAKYFDCELVIRRPYIGSGASVL